MPNVPQWSYEFLFGPGNFAAGVQQASVANQRLANDRRQALEERKQADDERSSAVLRETHLQQLEAQARKTREEMEFQDAYQRNLVSGLESYRKSKGAEPDHDAMVDITKRALLQSMDKLPVSAIAPVTERFMEDQRLTRAAADRIEAQRLLAEERNRQMEERNAIMQELGTMKNAIGMLKVENNVLKSKNEDERRQRETVYKTAVDIMNAEGSSFEDAMEKAVSSYKAAMSGGGTAPQAPGPKPTGKTRRAVLDPKTGAYRLDLNPGN